MNDYNGQQRSRFSGNNRGNYSNHGDVETPKQVFEKANPQPYWVTNEADKDLPQFAETMGRYMAKNGLTNSKIRSIYGEIKRIQMSEFEKEKASFYLLRPKVAYALGRDSKNNGLQLFKIVFDHYYGKVENSKTFLNFCNLLEAILAYHKAHGGKD